MSTIKKVFTLILLLQSIQSYGFEDTIRWLASSSGKIPFKTSKGSNDKGDLYLNLNRRAIKIDKNVSLGAIAYSLYRGPVWGEKGSMKKLLRINPALKNNPNAFIEKNDTLFVLSTELSKCNTEIRKGHYYVKKLVYSKRSKRKLVKKCSRDNNAISLKMNPHKKISRMPASIEPQADEIQAQPKNLENLKEIMLTKPLESTVVKAGEVNFSWERPKGVRDVVLFQIQTADGDDVYKRSTTGTRRTKWLTKGDYRWRLSGDDSIKDDSWIYFSVK